MKYEVGKRYVLKGFHRLTPNLPLSLVADKVVVLERINQCDETILYVAFEDPTPEMMAARRWPLNSRLEGREQILYSPILEPLPSYTAQELAEWTAFDLEEDPCN